ncbi:MAG: hypothetical protein QM451_06215 [Bacillota bacterium]|nr:hypothetical protein [Bacillota bacterium]HHT91528.1 hypothetical protein [Bacillota bacterium]
MKKRAKARTGRINPAMCLFYAVYNSVSILALGLFGQTTVGTLTSYSTRLDDSRAPTNASRTVQRLSLFSGRKGVQGSFYLPE